MFLINVRKIRKTIGISQEVLAKEMNVSQSAVAKWETGETAPQSDKLPKLAQVLGCSIEDLFDSGKIKE